MGHVPVSGRFERVAMDVSVISAKGYKYILVVCDYFTKYTEAYPLKDKTARSGYLDTDFHCFYILTKGKNLITR